MWAFQAAFYLLGHMPAPCSALSPHTAKWRGAGMEAGTPASQVPCWSRQAGGGTQALTAEARESPGARRRPGVPEWEKYSDKGALWAGRSAAGLGVPPGQRALWYASLRLGCHLGLHGASEAQKECLSQGLLPLDLTATKFLCSAGKDSWYQHFR